jgi:hypothetical protein
MPVISPEKFSHVLLLVYLVLVYHTLLYIINNLLDRWPRLALD